MAQINTSINKKTNTAMQKAEIAKAKARGESGWDIYLAAAVGAEKYNASMILGGGDVRSGTLPDALASKVESTFREGWARGDVQDGGFGSVLGVKYATMQAALSARRQQREGMGGSAQSSAVRRALAMARGRQGGTLGSGDDPGRKSVLGGGI